MHDALPTAPPTRIVRASAMQPWCDAWALLTEVQERAKTWDATCQIAHDEAARRGYADGLREGRLELATLLADTRADMAQRLQALEPHLIAIVMTCVRQLLGDGDPDAGLIARLTQQCLRQLPLDEPLVLWVAPDHAAALKQLFTATSLDVKPDESLCTNQAILIGYGRSIDISPGHQVSCLETFIAGQLRPLLAPAHG